jgi:hypothetical protein
MPRRRSLTGSDRAILARIARLQQRHPVLVERSKILLADSVVSLAIADAVLARGNGPSAYLKAMLPPSPRSTSPDCESLSRLLLQLV